MLGRPNVGKSSLVNAICGRKVSIVSDKPQTTRHRIMGVLTRPEHQIVFVDKGSNDGVERGDRLRVVSKGDPLTGKTKDMPYYDIAELVVMQANTTASTCVVVDSRREIQPGDTFFSITQ